jgi:multisubunit Na+/H+ antiporter MnhB subunit
MMREKIQKFLSENPVRKATGKNRKNKQKKNKFLQWLIDTVAWLIIGLFAIIFLIIIPLLFEDISSWFQKGTRKNRKK